MIFTIKKYMGYILAVLFIVWVILGYDIIPFFVGTAAIYITIYAIIFVTNRNAILMRKNTQTDNSPYRTLIKGPNQNGQSTKLDHVVSHAQIEETKINESAKHAETIKDDDDYDDNEEGYYAYDNDLEESDDEHEYEYDGEEDTSDDEFDDGSWGEDHYNENPHITEHDDFNMQYRKSKLLKVLSVVNRIPYMGGIEFEEFLQDLYAALGYEALKTNINDQGADLIVIHNGEKIAIQAKRYKSKVSNKAVQEVFTAKHVYDCERAIVITNSEFTKPAREVAEKVGVELWDAQSLKSMLESMKNMLD